MHKASSATMFTKNVLSRGELFDPMFILVYFVICRSIFIPKKSISLILLTSNMLAISAMYTEIMLTTRPNIHPSSSFSTHNQTSFLLRQTHHHLRRTHEHTHTQLFKHTQTSYAYTTPKISKLSFYSKPFITKYIKGNIIAPL